MVRYLYSWAPLLIVGSALLLTLPWLGLVALMVFALITLVALAALVWAIVAVPVAVARAAGRRWHSLRLDQPRATQALSEREECYLAIDEARGDLR